MTRDEYLEMLATEPATPTQVGAIMGEFARLGVGDRGERLAISADLLGVDGLGSTTDLVMGDAGRLVGILRRVRDRAELPAITAAAVDAEPVDGAPDGGEHQDDEHEQPDAHRYPATWPEALALVAALVYVAVTKRQHGELADIGLNVQQFRASGTFTSASGDSARTREEGISGD